MSILRNKPKTHIAVSQSEHLISVTSSSGNGTSAPTVGLEIRLPDMGMLTLDMCREEAYDLANELLAAVVKAQLKHEEQFGRGWNSTF
jgi:hypothetical protein